MSNGMMPTNYAMSQNSSHAAGFQFQQQREEGKNYKESSKFHLFLVLFKLGAKFHTFYSSLGFRILVSYIFTNN
jgi:hypothetical protein